MEPELQSPAQGNWAARLERMQKSRKAALEKCWAALERRDLIQINNQIEESLEEVDDMNINTLLYWSIRMDWYFVDQREILDWLFDQGLDINRGGNNMLKGPDRVYGDNTVAVLNQVAVKGDIDLFDHLVTRGARPLHSNALHHATRSNNAVAMITHLIVTYHLDVNAEDTCGGLNQPVMWDVTPGFPLNYAITYNNIPAAEVLLKYSANIRDACEIAIHKRNISAVKLLLDAGADPSKSLGTAITNDYLEAAQLCLEHGGDIAIGEARDKFVVGLGNNYTRMIVR
ncbi:hypothetical protein B7463_g11747, partial [Scytalidium lignicola]